MSSLRKEYEKNELDKERRKRYLSYLIKEAVLNALVEQEAAPVAPNPATAAQPAPAAAPAPTDPNNAAMTDPNAAGAQPPVNEEITLDKLIEKLNVVRGGRSFTDPEIYGQLTTLFKGWDDQTKQVVQKALDDIAKIVTLSAENQQATPPAPMDQQPAPPQGATPPTGAPSPTPPAPPVG